MVIYFDATCMYCNRAVSFIAGNSKSEKIYFAKIGGITYQKLLKNNPDLKEKDSVIVESNNEIFVASDAIFKIIQQLKWPYQLLLIAKIIPRFVNNYLYHCFAKHRHLLNSKKNVCLLKHQIQLLP